MENLFTIIDEDSTGRLTEENLSKALKEFFNEDDVLQRARVLMQKMDINENGIITIDEFMASLHPDLLEYEKLVIAYSYLQKEGK
jgi:Ca2+-binding EF-hand superfamily protein